MLLSLSEIMNLNGESRRLEAPLETSSFVVGGDELQVVKSLPIEFTVSARGTRSVILKSHIELTLIAPCSRCLEPVEVVFDCSPEYIYNFDEEGNACTEDDDEQISYINGYDLDVDAFVSEEVMIGFPMKVLCKEDCKGICKVCGANLNQGECGCDRTELDPRMSVIRDLFYNSNITE